MLFYYFYLFSKHLVDIYYLSEIQKKTKQNSFFWEIDIPVWKICMLNE